MFSRVEMGNFALKAIWSCVSHPVMCTGSGLGSWVGVQTAANYATTANTTLSLSFAAAKSDVGRMIAPLTATILTGAIDVAKPSVEASSEVIGHKGVEVISAVGKGVFEGAREGVKDLTQNMTAKGVQEYVWGTAPKDTVGLADYAVDKFSEYTTGMSTGSLIGIGATVLVVGGMGYAAYQMLKSSQVVKKAVKNQESPTAFDHLPSWTKKA